MRGGSLHANWILFSIVLLGLILRVWGTNLGLPYLFHPDEPIKIITAQNIFKTGDVNPHYFNKPTLFIYLNALAYVPYYLLGRLFGVFHSPSDILPPIMLTLGVGLAPLPTTVLMGRLITALFATASIPIIYLIGKRINAKASVGLLAAFMMAISTDNVEHSRYITENSFLVFFVLVVLWASVRIYQLGTNQDYVIAGVATGLAISSKYPGGMVVLVPLLAHFLRHKSEGLNDYRLYLIFPLSAFAFFATTPFALLDHKKFFQDTLSEVNHYASGHPGMEGNSLIWYIKYMWKSAGILYVLAVINIVRGIYLRSKEILLLTIFPVIFFIFISSFVVRNDRTFLPITPFLFLLAASLLVYSHKWISKLQSKSVRQKLTLALICLSLLAMLPPFVMTVARAANMMKIDSRKTASVWLAENLPPGARIGIEAYSPFIDPVRFSVTGFTSLIEHDPEWYVGNGFEYLVFSQGMYGRFFREPEMYHSEIAKYNSLFNGFDPIKIFNDGGYEVRIYQVKSEPAS